MKQLEVAIVISGPSASGKSRLLYELASVLEGKGFTVGTDDASNKEEHALIAWKDIKDEQHSK